MNPQLKRIRERLYPTQAEMADAVGVKQGTWSKYERGRKLPIKVAEKVIGAALSQGLLIDLNHCYKDIPLPPKAQEVKS